MMKIEQAEGLPWGPVVKNLPCNEGDMVSTPGQGTKIPHAMEQLSPLATIHVLQRKIPHGVTKILYATIKTRHRQINKI